MVVIFINIVWGTDRNLSKIIHGKAGFYVLLFSKVKILIWDIGKVSTGCFFSLLLLLGIPVLCLATSLTRSLTL